MGKSRAATGFTLNPRRYGGRGHTADYPVALGISDFRVRTGH